MSMPEVTHRFAHLDEAVIHYAVAGPPDGAPLVLLHGWPQTWHEWRHLLPDLCTRYRVVMPDLRGSGDSSKPAGGYDKRTIAADIAELLAREGIRRFRLLGHDWGGPTAYALAVANPDAVERLAILDVTIPGDGVEAINQGGKRWHHLFHRTLDLPEMLVQGRERAYITWFFRTFAHRRDAITEADIDEYARCIVQPGALRAGFGYYRATEQDAAHNRETVARFKLPMPVLALGGAESWGRRMECLESLRRVASDVQGGTIAGSGHWIPEEQPRLLLDRLLPFLAGEGA